MVTWDELTKDEQELLVGMNALNAPMTLGWTDSNLKLMQLDLIAKVSRGIDTTFKGALTPAGRAILPTPDVQSELLSQEYIDARQRAWDMNAGFVDYKTWLNQRAIGMEVQNALAIERALGEASLEAHAETLGKMQALEEEIAELKARFKRCFDTLLQVENDVAYALDHGLDSETALNEIYSKVSEALK